MSAEKLRRLAEALRDECAATKKARSDRTAQRLRSLAPTAGLSRTDIDIMELLLRYQSQPIIESMVDDVFGPTGQTHQSPQPQGSGAVLAPRNLGQHRPPAVSKRRAARPLGTPLDRQRRRPDACRPAAPPRHHPRRLERRRHSPAAGHRVRERPRVVGLRPRRRRPRPRRKVDERRPRLRCFGRERAPVRPPRHRQDSVLQGAGRKARRDALRRGRVG